MSTTTIVPTDQFDPVEVEVEDRNSGMDKADLIVENESESSPWDHGYDSDKAVKSPGFLKVVKSMKLVKNLDKVGKTFAGKKGTPKKFFPQKFLDHGHPGKPHFEAGYEVLKRAWVPYRTWVPSGAVVPDVEHNPDDYLPSDETKMRKAMELFSGRR